MKKARSEGTMELDAKQVVETQQALLLPLSAGDRKKKTQWCRYSYE